MKTEITTIEELKLDIEHIKSDLEWAKTNDSELVSWLEMCLQRKEEKLVEWIKKNSKIDTSGSR